MDGTILLIFGTSLIVGFSGAMMPGPLLTVAVSESARRGFTVGPLLVTGHGIVEVLLLVALSLGLSQFLQFAPVKGGIAIVGGFVLLWMGYGIAREVWQRAVSLLAPPPALPVATNRYVLAGALVSVSNPYWILWWATVGAGYVVWALGAGPLGLVSFYAGHILADLAWYSLITAAVASGGRFLSATLYRAVLGGCGLFLIVLALGFVVAGVGYWTGGS